MAQPRSPPVQYESPPPPPQTLGNYNSPSQAPDHYEALNESEFDKLFRTYQQRFGLGEYRTLARAIAMTVYDVILEVEPGELSRDKLNHRVAYLCDIQHSLVLFFYAKFASLHALRNEIGAPAEEQSPSEKDDIPQDPWQERELLDQDLQRRASPGTEHESSGSNLQRPATPIREFELEPQNQLSQGQVTPRSDPLPKYSRMLLAPDTELISQDRSLENPSSPTSDLPMQDLSSPMGSASEIEPISTDQLLQRLSSPRSDFLLQDRSSATPSASETQPSSQDEPLQNQSESKTPPRPRCQRSVLKARLAALRAITPSQKIQTPSEPHELPSQTHTPPLQLASSIFGRDSLPSSGTPQSELSPWPERDVSPREKGRVGINVSEVESSPSERKRKGGAYGSHNWARPATRLRYS